MEHIEPEDGNLDELMEEAPLPFTNSTADFIERHTHCALCGANLHLAHVTDFIRNLTQEVARCPECGVQARKVVHKLQ